MKEKEKSKISRNYKFYSCCCFLWQDIADAKIKAPLTKYRQLSKVLCFRPESYQNIAFHASSAARTGVFGWLANSLECISSGKGLIPKCDRVRTIKFFHFNTVQTLIAWFAFVCTVCDKIIAHSKETMCTVQ